MPKKRTAAQRLKERTDKASAILATTMELKTPKGKILLTYMRIASKLEITMPTIVNYKNGLGSNGFMIEAITAEFRKLPDVIK